MGQWNGVFGFLGPLMFLGIAAVYIIFLLAAWRAMRAHEEIASSLKIIADKMKREP